MADKYNVGIIGFGTFGKLHLEQLSKFSNVNVVGISDINPKVWDEYAHKYAGVKFFPNSELLLNDNLIDAVHITSDEESHYSIALKALKANKHIFVEKPLSVSSEQAREIHKLASLKNRKVGVGHLLRYESRHMNLRKKVVSGELGTINCITLRRNFKREMLEVYGRVNAFVTAIVHDIDLAQYFTGSRIKSVLGIQEYAYKSSYQFNVAALKTESNITCLLENIWLLPNDYPYDMEFEVVIYGDKGVARTRIQPDVEYFEQRQYYPEIMLDDALERELKHFVSYVMEQGEPITPTLYEAVHTVEIAELLIDSAKNVHWNHFENKQIQNIK